MVEEMGYTRILCHANHTDEVHQMYMTQCRGTACRMKVVQIIGVRLVLGDRSLLAMYQNAQEKMITVFFLHFH